MYFYNARWYDPALGRFIQADTIVPGPGNSQAWDRYSYGYGNPVKYIDPSGHGVDCGIWESYCVEGRLDFSRRAFDLAEYYRSKAQEEGFYRFWYGLSGYERSILIEAGWTEGEYNDSISIQTSHADPGHDPAVIIIGIFAGTRLLYGFSQFAKLIGSGLLGYQNRDSFGPGFSNEEIKTIQTLIKESGLNFKNINFWRGEGAPPNYFGSGGSDGITFYDSFFSTTAGHQMEILIEEYIHANQLIVNYSNNVIIAAENLAKILSLRDGK